MEREQNIRQWLEFNEVWRKEYLILTGHLAIIEIV